jgi:hypothetical protein
MLAYIKVSRGSQIAHSSYKHTAASHYMFIVLCQPIAYLTSIGIFHCRYPYTGKMLNYDSPIAFFLHYILPVVLMDKLIYTKRYMFVYNVTSSVPKYKMFCLSLTLCIYVF